MTLGYSRSGIYTVFSARLLQLKSLADGHISLSAPPGDGSDDGVPWPRMQAARSLAAARLNATSCARARGRGEEGGRSRGSEATREVMREGEGGHEVMREGGRSRGEKSIWKHSLSFCLSFEKKKGRQRQSK